MSELLPCPFCGEEPCFPAAKDTFGACYECGCADCGMVEISIQIIDCFDYPKDHVHDSYNNETHQYGIEYIEVARQQAINAWNTRTSQWMPIESAPKSKTCLVFYKNELGNGRIVKARYVERFSEETIDDDHYDYHEGNDEFYVPEGWYEQIDNWDDYSSVAIHHQITHWMPLPSAPKD